MFFGNVVTFEIYKLLIGIIWDISTKYVITRICTVMWINEIKFLEDEIIT